MQKSGILALAVCLLLAGCGAPPEAPAGSDGTSSEQETAVVPELEETVDHSWADWDFDRDGTAETVEAVTFREPEGARAAWHQLRISTAAGKLLWSQDAAEAHIGWTALFALELDGEDCLLRYNPSMGQGACTFTYQIFSLDGEGEERVLLENSVSFDLNFGSETHEAFDPAAIAAFLEEVHGYLAESTLLLSTDGGTFRTGGSGADFRESVLGTLWDEACPYDEEMTLEENLRNYREFQERDRNI